MARRSSGHTTTPGLAPDRRDFLKAGLAASALPAVGAASLVPTAAWAGAETVRFYKIVYDQHDPAAIAFGRAAAAAGHDTYAVGGDLTALWYELKARWRKGPVAIGGLTGQTAAMCLEMMGWDAGMRTVFRADHKPLADGGVRHLVSGPDAMLARAALLDTGSGWGAGASRLLSACPAAHAVKSSLSLDSAPYAGPALSEPLVSWVVAPVRRA